MRMTMVLPGGSSPLTRGKPWSAIVDAWNAGLIPAHAGKTRASASQSVSCAAHPRSRGENQVHAIRQQITAGSSPLTRGKHSPGKPVSLGKRLIPAHAGKTPCPTRRRSPCAAHPRSRGENAAHFSSGRDESGSSPLTRGKHAGLRCMEIARGLIPAHAGKTCQTPDTTAEIPAHPRSRGENSEARIHTRSFEGSSPLTRGKPPTLTQPSRPRRLIPAHAGKTQRAHQRQRLARAHPRSRGENHKIKRISHGFEGSSPLTRGKLATSAYSAERDRLIPAHAGKTSIEETTGALSAAHPRSRGENLMKSVSKDPPSGSSPLTRGKRGFRRVPSVVDRLIPAHAGKTTCFYSLALHIAAHPRSRGENINNTESNGDNEGSSPLTRGKRRDRQVQEHTQRLIPAHAGKTGRPERPAGQ